MPRARKVLLACYGLTLALVFIWLPWTQNAGYSWLWSRPRERPLNAYDLVGEARHRLESDYRASDLNAVGEKWLEALQEAPSKDRESVRQHMRKAVELARWHRVE